MSKQHHSFPPRGARSRLFSLPKLLLLSGFVAAQALAQELKPNLAGKGDYAGWGKETTAQIERDFYDADSKLYLDNITVRDGGVEKSDPAFMWGCGVQLSMLVEAAAADPAEYRKPLDAYARALQVYWQKSDPLGGYDVLPCPKPLDRYYDDNVWVALALLKGYRVTGDAAYLRQAEATMRFVRSGEDDKVDGGIYWKEVDRSAKHSCSTGPAIVAELEMYRATRNPVNLLTARRLYSWMRSHLQDGDGLYWDNISVKGKVDKNKYSYNTALMIRAGCLFYEITRDKNYLKEAQRIGQAALDRWVRPDGSVDDGGRFAHLLMGAFVALSKVDPDPKWMDAVDRIVQFVHGHLKGADGRYPGSWKAAPDKPPEKFELLDQASVAHAYWEAANAHARR